MNNLLLKQNVTSLSRTKFRDKNGTVFDKFTDLLNVWLPEESWILMPVSVTLTVTRSHIREPMCTCERITEAKSYLI